MDFIPKKKLGFGLMRMPLKNASDPTAVDVEQVKDMVDLFLERGFTYFDTAWMYHDFVSERVAGEALVSRHPRESFTLATKMHAGFFKDKEDRERMLDAQLEKTGAGYFDYYLLHGIDAELIGRYEETDSFSWLLDKKEKGIVRHAGFSFHGTPELLDRVLTQHPEMEFVQLQINYLDWESQWIHSRACYETAVKHGKQIIVMEPAKGGTLAKLPERAEKLFKDYDPSRSAASWAIRFAAGLPGVMMVLSGMTDMAQLEDNTGYMSDMVPLTEEEKAMCFKAADIINEKIAVPCTACSYCTGGCPQGIPIPKFFSLYNEDMRDRLDEKGWTANIPNYLNLSAEYNSASACVECGQCEGVCPQHLPIIKLLKDVAEHYARLG